MAKTFTTSSIPYHGQKTAPAPFDWVGRLQPVSDRFPNPGTRARLSFYVQSKGGLVIHTICYLVLCVTGILAGR